MLICFDAEKIKGVWMKLILGILMSASTIFGADNLSSSSNRPSEKEQQDLSIKAFVEKHEKNAPEDYALLTVGKIYSNIYLVAYLTTTKNYKQMDTDALKLKLGTLDHLSDITISGIGIDDNPVDKTLQIFASLWHGGYKKLLSYNYCNDQGKAILDDNYWIDLESCNIRQDARLELLYTLKTLYTN